MKMRLRSSNVPMRPGAKRCENVFAMITPPNDNPCDSPRTLVERLAQHHHMVVRLFLHVTKRHQHRQRKDDRAHDQPDGEQRPEAPTPADAWMLIARDA